MAELECTIDSDNEGQFFAQDPQDETEESTINEEECLNYFLDDDHQQAEVEEYDIIKNKNKVAMINGHDHEEQNEDKLDDDYDSSEESRSIIDLMSQIDEFEND